MLYKSISGFLFMYTYITLTKDEIIYYKKWCKYFNLLSKFYRDKKDVSHLNTLSRPISIRNIGIFNQNLEDGVLYHYNENNVLNCFILSRIRLIDYSFVFNDTHHIMFSGISTLIDKEYIECDIKCIMIGNRLIFKIIENTINIKTIYPHTNVRI